MSQVTAEMIARGRSAPASSNVAQRRRNAQQMRTARERLTSSGAGFRTFNIDLMQAFVRTQRFAIQFQAVLVAATAVALAAWVPFLALATWASQVLGVTGLLWVMVRRYERGYDAAAADNRWNRRFIAVAFVQGVAWGGIVVFVNGSDTRVLTCVLASILLDSIMVALVLSAVIERVYAALAPVTVAIAALLLQQFNTTTLPQAVLAIGMQGFCFVVARRLHAISLANITMQAERDASIVELEQARLNSDEARRRAEEANLAKSRFLATMSHELRTPLNAILGFSEVMKSELFGPHSAPIYKEYSQDVHSSGEHLLMLINEILDLSRVEAGRYDLREEPIQLAYIVDDCVHLLQLRANQRQIKIVENVERDLPMIWADERAMRQVVLNLLSNAIKFTPQGGTVTIETSKSEDKGQYVSIRDTGPGIPEHEIPIVMSAFGRGTLAQKNADEGTGLGLPIVKGLVEMHGGTFTLTSKVRQGTKVTVLLPPERIIDALPRLDEGNGETEVRSRPTPKSSAA